MVTYPRCSTAGCVSGAFWRVKARVPSTQTSRLGNKSFNAPACHAHLSDVIGAALDKVAFTAPAKVSIERPTDA